MNGRPGSKPCLGLIVHRGRDALFEGFMSAMAEHGHLDDRTISIEPRFAEGVLDRTAGFAEDLVRKKVDIIVAIGAVGAREAQKATSTIPIVFAIVLDPVETGFAASLDRPGGNMTGVTSYDPFLAVEQLSLLRDVVPGLNRVAVLSDASNSRPFGSNSLERSFERAAAKFGVELIWFRQRSPVPDRAAIFRDVVLRECKAVQVLEVPANIADFEAIATLANEHQLPAMFPDGWQCGGLMSYGTSLLQTVAEIPRMIVRLLDGTLPGDIPIRQVRRHRLRVNLTTARQINIEIPHGVIARADELIT